MAMSAVAVPQPTNPAGFFRLNRCCCSAVRAPWPIAEKDKLEQSWALKLDPQQQESNSKHIWNDFKQQQQPQEEIAGELASILRERRGHGSDLDEALADWRGLVPPGVVGRVLRQVNDVACSILFFNWASAQPGFEHSCYSCNCMLCALVNGLHLDRAAELYRTMLHSGVQPNRSTYGILIRGFSKRSLSVNDALRLFDEMREAGLEPDRVTYNAVVAGLCRTAQLGTAFRVYDMMRQSGLVNRVTVNTLVYGVCRHGRSGRRAVRLLREMQAAGIRPGRQPVNAVLSRLCKDGQLDEALLLFRGVRADADADVFTYSALINGCFRAGRPTAAMELFREMDGRGCAANRVTYNTVVDGLIRANRMDEARSILRRMLAAHCAPDAVTYTVLIRAALLGQPSDGDIGRPAAALQLLGAMRRRGCEPDNVAYSTLLCGICAAGDGGAVAAREVLAAAMEGGFEPDRVTFTALVDGLCRAGMADAAEEVYGWMSRRQVAPDEAARSALLAGLCRCGRVDRALRHLEAMEQEGDACGTDACYVGDAAYVAVVSTLCSANRGQEALEMVRRMVWRRRRRLRREMRGEGDESVWRRLVVPFYRLGGAQVIEVQRLLPRLKRNRINGNLV